MKVILIAALCAILVPIGAFGQETHVRVSKGAVEIETPSGTQRIEAGQEGSADRKGDVRVKIDEPLARDIPMLTQWIVAEKMNGQDKIDSSSVQVQAIENVKERRVVALAEVPNRQEKASSTVEIGPTAWGKDTKVYDLEGRVLTYETKAVSSGRYKVTIDYKKPVEPKGVYSLMLVTSGVNAPEMLWHEGKLWTAQMSNMTPNCLNYWQLVLPPSAILVDTSLPPIATRTIDGQLVVTIRNYTGRHADSTVLVSFLWPGQDGGTLEDVPGRYRGLIDLRAAGFNTAASEALGGKVFADQGTPVEALLKLVSAAARKDTEAVTSVAYALASGQVSPEMLDKMWGPLQQFMSGFEMISTPDWPAEPNEGYVHPVYVRAKGNPALIRSDTLALVFHKGKWYYMGNMGNPRDTDVSVFKKQLQGPK